MKNRISSKITRLGEELTHCPLINSCEKVENSDPLITPRCLYLDPQNPDKVDVIVVGINPGKLNKSDKEYREYEKNDGKTIYQKQMKYFETLKQKASYYIKLEKLLSKSGMKNEGRGVLWTELCKCQCSSEEKILPLQTLRVCSRKYLARELSVLKDSILIAVGYQAYSALSFLYPDRCVIGVVHPSGAKINYDEYIEKCVKKIDLSSLKESKRSLWISSRP